jgi:hypothetical protein
MKKTVFPWFAAILILLTMPYCGKSGGGGDACSSETTLAVTTSPAVNADEAAAPGPTFPLTVTITSALPGSGVTIKVTARPDGNATTFFSEERSTTTSVNNFTITGAPSGVKSLVEITVTSKTCNTNKWTGSYRFSRK